MHVLRVKKNTKENNQFSLGKCLKGRYLKVNNFSKEIHQLFKKNLLQACLSNIL